MRKIGLYVRFALRNILYYKLQSILLFVSFVIIFVICFMGLANQPVVERYFISREEEKYQNIDLIVGTSQNTNTRFFSIRPFLDAPLRDTFVQDFAPFFEIDTLVGISEQKKQYAKVFSSSTEHLIKILDQSSSIDLHELSSNQVVITKTVAEIFDVEEFGTLFVYIGSQVKEFEIVAVIEDGGLFTGNSIFINKEYSLSYFLQALDPALSGISNTFLRNFYNTIYITLQDDVTLGDAVIYMQTLQGFSGLEYTQAISYESLIEQANRTVAFLYAIIIIILMAVTLVIGTTFSLRLSERRGSFATISLLGGKRSVAFFVYFIEFLVLIVSSGIIGMFLANYLLAIGIQMMGSSFVYQLDLIRIVLGFGIVFVLFFLVSGYVFLKASRQSSIAFLKEASFEKKVSLKPIIGVFGLVLLVIVVLHQIGLRKTIPSIVGFLEVVLYFVMGFLALWIILFGLLAFWKKRKRTPASFLLQISASKRSFVQYLLIMYVSFLSVFLLFGTRMYVDVKMDQVKSEIGLEYVITNMVTRFEETYQTIQTLEDVESASRGYLYRDIYIKEVESTISSLVALEQNITTFFDFSYDEGILEELSIRDTPVIVLPKDFEIIYGMRKGDDITLTINPQQQDVVFEVIGFYYAEVSQVAFANLTLVSQWQDVRMNAIFVNGVAGSNLFPTLISLFSQNMTVIIDFQAQIGRVIADSTNIMEFVTYIVMVIIVCFVFSIFNQSLLLFAKLRQDYARIYSLGASKQMIAKVHVIEQSIVLAVILCVSMVSLLFVNAKFYQLLLPFGQYERLYITQTAFIVSIVVCIIVFYLAKIVYIRQIQKENFVTVLKNY